MCKKDASQQYGNSAIIIILFIVEWSILISEFAKMTLHQSNSWLKYFITAIRTISLIRVLTITSIQIMKKNALLNN